MWKSTLLQYGLALSTNDIQATSTFTQTSVLYGVSWFYVTINPGFHLDIDSDGLISKPVFWLVKMSAREMLLVVDNKLTAFLCWILALLLFSMFENVVLPSDSSSRRLPELAALLLEFSLYKNLLSEEVLKKSIRKPQNVRCEKRVKIHCWVYWVYMYISKRSKIW